MGAHKVKKAVWMGYRTSVEKRQLCWMYVNCFNETMHVSYTKTGGCFTYSWALLPPTVRYSEKHIGLGTKKYIDRLGGC